MKYFSLIILIFFFFINKSSHAGREEGRSTAEETFAFHILPLALPETYIFLFAFYCNLLLFFFNTKSSRTMLRTSTTNVCRASPVGGMIDTTWRMQDQFTKPLSSCGLLCNIYHRMENMCDFNIEQSHLPKSQLRQQQQQKKGSLETLVFALNIYLPVF